MLRYSAIAEEPENEGNAGERRKNEQTSRAANSGTSDEKHQSAKSDNSDPKRLSAKSARLSTSAFNEDTMDESGSDRFSLTDEDDEFFTEDEESSELSKSFKKEKRKESKPKENKKVKSTAEEDEEELLKAGILNANQIREIKEAFHVFDVNGDGCITATELKKLVTSLGYNITEAELMDMMNQIDSDGNGAIDFPEFLSLMTKNLDDYDPEDILQESFKVFDRDNSGFIGVSELDRVFRLLGQDFKDYEIEAMIKAADADGDGLVSYDDFVKMMNV